MTTISTAQITTPASDADRAVAIRSALSGEVTNEAFRAACKEFAEIQDDAVVETLVDEFPRLLYFDGNGDFIGTPRNENGWTA